MNPFRLLHLIWDGNDFFLKHIKLHAWVGVYSIVGRLSGSFICIFFTCQCILREQRQESKDRIVVQWGTRPDSSFGLEQVSKWKSKKQKKTKQKGSSHPHQASGEWTGIKHDQVTSGQLYACHYTLASQVPYPNKHVRHFCSLIPTTLCTKRMRSERSDLSESLRPCSYCTSSCPLVKRNKNTNIHTALRFGSLDINHCYKLYKTIRTWGKVLLSVTPMVFFLSKYSLLHTKQHGELSNSLCYKRKNKKQKHFQSLLRGF